MKWMKSLKCKYRKEKKKKDPISGVRNADLIQMKSQIWLEKMSSVNMEIISLI